MKPIIGDIAYKEFTPEEIAADRIREYRLSE